ncbi:MAG: hypothetical protein ABL890_04315 [Candidatus Peribacteraceae bacterium]
MSKGFLYYFIPLFCVIHMAAVGCYLLPKGISAPTDFVKHWTFGYVRTLSQWQKWDIFSPNPLRRVSEYRIERDAGDRWEPAMTLTFDTLPWWKRAKDLKVLGRLEENQWIHLAEPYLRWHCRDQKLSQSPRIRLVALTRILPFTIADLSRYSLDRTPPTSTVLAIVSCPRSI